MPIMDSNSKRFSILQWNVNSIRPRSIDIYTLIDKHNPCIFLFCDTRLKPGINIYFKGYSCFRKDSPTAAGGLAIFIRKDLSCRQLSLGPFDREILGISIFYNNSNLNILSCYDNNGSCNISQLNNILSSLNGPIFFAGDLNAHCTAWGSPSSGRQGERLLDCFNNNNLCLLNNGNPTFFSNSYRTESHLDITFCSPSLHLNADWAVLQGGSSDHYPIITFLGSFNDRNINNKTYWNIKSANWDKFNISINNNIPSFSLDCDINDNCTVLNNHILQAAASSATQRVVKRFDRIPPAWWNAECSKAIKDRDLAKSRAIRSSRLDDYIEFKRLAANAVRLIKKAKSDNFHDFVFNSSDEDIRSFAFRRAKGKKNSFFATIPPLLREDGTYAISPLERAEAMLKPFVVPAYPADRINFLNRKSTKDNLIIINNIDNSLFNIKDLEFAIGSLKVGAPGPDNISNAFIINFSSSMKLSLLAFFNACWHQGDIPDAWRSSEIRAIPKPGKDRCLASNYRHIALTSCLLKLFEKLVANRLIFYFESNGFIPECQSGFRKGRSTTDALLDLEADIYNGRSQKHFTVVAFMDVKRAFDTVLHPAILAKLRHFGVEGRSYNFCKAYLSNRKYFINVEGSFSSVTLSCGTPQGGVLSPHLFSLVANDIGGNMPPDIPRTLYADDFATRTSGRHLDQAVGRLNHALKAIKNYADVWGIDFDPNKSKVVIFANPITYYCSFADSAIIRYGDVQLEVVKTHKFLGVFFTSNMCWQSHINYVIKSCQPALCLLRSVSSRSWGSSFPVLRQLYIALIRSKIEYGLEVYGNCSPTDFKKLEGIQAAALRSILGVPKSTSSAACQVLANVPALHYRRAAALARHIARQFSFNSVLIKNKLSMFSDVPNWRLRKPAILEGAHFIFNNNFIEMLDHMIPSPRYAQPSQVVNDNLRFNLDWAPFKKSETNNSLLHALFHSALQEGNPEGWPIFYTDGSHCPASLANGAGIFCASPPLTLSIKALKGLTIMSTELLAIIIAINYAITNNISNFVIASDSLSGLKCINNHNISHSFVKCIIDLCTNNHVFFIWTPGHVGIAGNERADLAAKAALSSPDADADRRFPLSDAAGAIRHVVFRLWHQDWQSCVTGRDAYEVVSCPGIRPSTTCLSRPLFSIVNRLLCNRAPFNGFLSLIGSQADETCTACHVKEDSKHYLLSCCKYDLERLDLINVYNSHNIPFNFSTLLGGADAPPHIISLLYIALFKYVNSTVGFKFFNYLQHNQIVVP